MYTDVIQTMSTARINILTQRPLLRHLKHLTLKYFEIFCADTIPLLMLDDDHAEEVYGPAARELTLPGRVAREDRSMRCDIEDRYRGIVDDVRAHLRDAPLLRHARARAVRGAARARSVTGMPMRQGSPPMKIVFVYWGYENAGSMLDLRGYTRAAKAMGHEVIVYGPPDAAFALDYSKDLSRRRRGRLRRRMDDGAAVRRPARLGAPAAMRCRASGAS